MTQSPLASIHVATLRALLDVFRAKGDTVAVRLIEQELFYRQPIVVKPDYIGFTATRGDYDLDDRIGHGRTEQEATDALLELEDWDREDAGFYERAVDDGGMAEERRRHP